jgi:hypothetical protein
MNISFDDSTNELVKIISQKPPYVIRWGTYLFLILLSTVILICSFIKHPVIITSSTVLSCTIPPQIIKSKITGKLLRLNVSDNQNVLKGKVIAVIKSTGNETNSLHATGNIDTLTASTGGRFVFTDPLQEKQIVQSNQVIGRIIPENEAYYAEILIPAKNFNKIFPGQEVILKFPSFPFDEFGMLKGKIDTITKFPGKNYYSGRVIFPYGLITTLKKQIKYQDGLNARAEVIIKNESILKGFYSSIIQQIQKK